MNAPSTILVTIHGSHLYGLNHSDSDLDFFRVVENAGPAFQRVTGGFDVVQMTLDSFLTHVFNGSHQSCEAMFSQQSWVDPKYKPMFDSMRVTGANAFARYERTIKSFSYGDDKKRRHAVRLGYNLAGLRANGRFNPVLTDDQRANVMELSKQYRNRVLFDIASNLQEEE